MASDPLPKQFQEAYFQRETYPQNIRGGSLSQSPAALEFHRSRLDAAGELLLQSEPAAGQPNPIDVHFRDLGPDNDAGKGLEKYDIGGLARLISWLGIKETAPSQQQPTAEVAVTKRDPKCRFIYIYGQSSRSPLKVTRPMLELILTFHQVMPEYLEFMHLFGLSGDAKDLLFTGFRNQVSLSPPQPHQVVTALARTGRQYQLCYNLRGVTLKERDSARGPLWDKWSVRQAAFYHRFDVGSGNALWIVTKGGKDVKERFKDLTGKDARPEDKDFATPEDAFRSSLAAHLLFAYWATEDWLGYIKWLELSVGGETDMAVLGPTAKQNGHTHYSDRDVQILQMWIEQICNYISVLEGNVEILKSLASFYGELAVDDDFPLKDRCQRDIARLKRELKSITDNSRMQISRAQALVVVVRDRKELVKLHYERQSANRLESMTVHMEREAIVVRIITIVTLVYLPATFVSTFFSTDVIKYQTDGGPPGSGIFSDVAMLRWVQVTLPLTALTVVVAWAAFMWARRFIRKREMLSAPSLQRDHDGEDADETPWRTLWKWARRPNVGTLLPTHSAKAATPPATLEKGLPSRLLRPHSSNRTVVP